MKINSINLTLVLSLLGVCFLSRTSAQSFGSQTNLLGSTFQLVGPTEADFSDYQWIKDGLPLQDTNRISGSQSPVLTIDSAVFTDTGSYILTAMVDTNGPQTLTLTNIIVYIVDQPAIESFATINASGGVTFSVGATGGLLSYQWYWQGQVVPGATSSALVYSNAYATASAGFYSVVITNPVGQVSSLPPGLLFTKTAPPGTYQGLFFDTNSANVDLGSSGFIQYTIPSSQRTFTGKIVMLQESFPFSGAFSLAHDSQVTVQRKNRSPLQLALQLVATNNTAQVFGTVTADVWTSALQGNLLYYGSLKPFAHPGKYTLSLQDTNFPIGTGPDGASYGVVHIARNGMVTMSGLAADGTALAQGCGLAKNGAWPFYAVMYNGAGVMSGWLQVQAQSTSSILGSAIYWIKPPMSGRLYPGGINSVLQAQGSTYTVTPGASVLPFALGVAGFSGGDLISDGLPFWDFVRITRPAPGGFFVAEPSPEHVMLSVNRPNGVVSGGFVDLATGRRVQMKGVVLQQQNMAAGYFLSTNSSGYFTLAPSQ